MMEFSPDFMYLLREAEDDAESTPVERAEPAEPLERRVAAAAAEHIEAPKAEQMPERGVGPGKEKGCAAYHTIVTDDSILVTLWSRDFPPKEFRKDGSRRFDEFYTVAHRSVIADAGVCLRYYRNEFYLQTSFLATKKGYSAIKEFLEKSGDSIISMQESTSVMLKGHNFDLRVRAGKNLVLVEVDPELFPIRQDEVARERMKLRNGKHKLVWRFKTADRRAEMYDALKGSYEAAGEVLTKPL